MPKAKVPKNLAVDGTDKLAAKAKPSDKHEKPDLNIEEATIASPRPSRKRAGDYFDFDGEGAEADDAEPSSKATETKVAPPKKKTKTVGADEAGKEGRKAKGAKADAPAKPKKETEEKKPKAAKADAAPKKEKAETKSKSKKSTAAAVTENTMDAATAVAPDVTMDEGPFEKLVGSDKGKEPANTKATKARAPKTKAPTIKEKASEAADALTKEVKGAIGETKKAAKNKAPTTKSAAGATDEITKGAKGAVEKTEKAVKGKAPTKDTAAEAADNVAKETKAAATKAAKAAKNRAPTTGTVAEVADKVTKETKGAVEKKKAMKAKAPKATETAAEVSDMVTKEAKAAAEKATKVAKDNGPSTEKVAGAAESVKKSAKDTADKITKTAKAQAPTTETATKASDGAKKQAKAGAEKVKRATKAKDDAKPEPPKSKKRKSSSGDAETVKADILDPLSEHAEESAKKKQKTQKSKTIGGAVGDLIAHAAESATAARASFGGFASSLLGVASDAVGTASETAQNGAKNAKGKGKAIASDVAESSTKAAAPKDTEDDDEEVSDEEPDDHTAALLAGFESDGDNIHPSGPGFEKGQKLPELPHAKETIRKLKDVKEDSNEGTGVVYVGRIPHGFFEHEMRQYFSQFGDITRLRLSRNKKTGASRHWALIEFKSAGVANIVAGTMDNYLMFGHILKCKVVEKAQLHEDVWKGADKRFKKVPWNKMEGRKHEMAVGRDHWEGRIENEKKRRESKQEKMKEIGYEFTGGALKGVDGVPVKAKMIAEGQEEVEEEKSLVTAGGEEGQTIVVSEEIKTKKTKKSSKGDVTETTTTVVKKGKRTLDAGEEAAGSATKKAKKASKAST
jgi:nucleolar protein 15